MLNFTGSTKKRTVNLGNRSNPNRGKFLEQNRIDRLERELQREKERKATILQTHVRRFLELSVYAKEILDSWLRDFDLSSTGLPNSSAEGSLARTAGLNWNHWCAQFRFVSRFGPLNTLGSALHVLEYLLKFNESHPQNSVVSEFDLTVLIRSINKVKDRGLAPEVYVQSLNELFNSFQVPRSYLLPLKSTMKHLSESLTPDNFQVVLRIAFEVNIADSKASFFLFFATLLPIDLFQLENYSAVLTRCLSQSLEDVASFPPAIKTSILVNMARVLSNTREADVKAFAEILGTMNFQLTTSTEQESSNDISNDEFSKTSPFSVGFYRLYSINSMLEVVNTFQALDQRQKDSITEIHISEEVSSQLEKLTSVMFILQGINTLRLISSGLAISFICHLLHVFHDQKSNICMMIASTPELPHWLFDQLLGHSIYQQIKNTDEKDTCSMSEWREFSEVQHILFWDLVYCYEQFLSYWLIVSKTHDSSKDNTLPINDVKDFCRFLKTLCLTLIFKDSDFVQIQRVSELSLSLLNQLYMRNLHLRFLPKLFWILQEIKFDIPSMLSAILEDDAESESEGSSDDESTKNPSKKIQHRRLDTANKLQVLKQVPFFFNFKDRVQVFQSLINADKHTLGSGSDSVFFSDDINSRSVQVDINRETPFEDAFENLFMAGPNLRNKWKVSFHNAHGPEAGIDGGGLTKELLNLVVFQAIDKNKESGLGLFKETETYELYPNNEIYLRYVAYKDSWRMKSDLECLEFFGMIIGKCLYESVLIDVKFAPFFLAKWKINQRMKSSINDLMYLDSSVYQSLNKLLEMSSEELQTLDLDFTINEVVDGKVREYSLIPSSDGHVPVLIANRLSYVHLVLDFKLNRSLQAQTRAFLEGLFKIIKPNWLNMFDPFELQMLISGGNDIDLEDWKRNVLYGGYFDDDITIKLFWEVVDEMSSQERCDLVKFVTSVSRAPLLGFGALNPNFGISNSGSPDRLPTTSTCLNLLKLPDYKDKRLLREKLLYALNANSGFDLS